MANMFVRSPVFVYQESLLDMEFDPITLERPTEFDWQNLDSANTIPSTITNIDGVVVLGRTWNIFAIDGMQEITVPDIIYVRAPTAYVGMYENLQMYSLIFEINLFTVNGITLSAILCTESLSKIHMIELDAGQILQTFRESINDAINQLPAGRASRIELGYRCDGRILIHHEDWNNIGLSLREAAQANFTNDTQIPSPDIYFIAVQSQIGLKLPMTYEPRNLKTENSIATTVVFSLEYYVHGHILWWKTNNLQVALNRIPRGGFQRVAALPGLGNGVFYTTNRICPQLEYRTKLFDEIRRDRFGILEGNKLTVLIAELCHQILHATGNHSKIALTEVQKAITSKEFLGMLDHCKQSVPPTVPATIEVAYKACAIGVANVPRLEHIVANAIQFIEQQIITGMFGEPRQLLHAMPTSIFRERHTQILNICTRSLRPVMEYLQFYEDARNLFDIYAFNMDYEQMGIVYIANALLRFYFYGAFCQGFPYTLRQPLNLISQKFWSPKQRFTPCWPFNAVTYSNGAIVPPSINYKEIPVASALLHNKESMLIEKMRELLETIVEYASMDSNTSEWRSYIRKYFNVILEYVLLISLDDVGEDCENRTCDDMLFTMWEYHIQRKRVHIDSTQVYGMLKSGQYGAEQYLDKKYDIAVLAVNELRQLGMEDELKTIFSTCVENLMFTNRIPFRIITEINEVVVLPVGRGNYDEGDIQTCWQKAFNNLKRDKSLKRPAYRFKKIAIFSIIEEWLIQNKYHSQHVRVDDMFDMIAELLREEVRFWCGVHESLLANLNKIHEPGSCPKVSLNEAPF